jgi:hypothetical protein
MTLAAMTVPIGHFWLSVKRFYVQGTGSGTLMDVPSWIPEGAFLLGMVLFWIQLFAYTLRVITGEADLRTERAVDLGTDA